MAAEVFLVILVCFCKAFSQNCGNNIFPGALRPSPICPSAAEPTGFLPLSISTPQELSSIDCSSNIRGTVVPFNPFKSYPTLESLGQNSITESIITSSNLNSNSGVSSTSCGLKSLSGLDNLPRPISSLNDVSLGSCRSENVPRFGSFGLTQSPLLNNLQGSISLPDLSTSCAKPSPLLPLYNCQPQLPPTVVIDDIVTDKLADSLQFVFLNDLTETSRNCRPVCETLTVKPDRSRFLQSEAVSAKPCNTPILRSPTIGPFSNGAFNINNFGLVPQSNPIQTSVSIAEASNSGSLASSAVSSATVSEASSVNVGPRGIINAYGGFNNIAHSISSSTSVAETSSTVVEPNRASNIYPLNNIGYNTPLVSTSSISESTSRVEPLRNCNPFGLSPTIVPEISPINFDTGRRFPNNYCGGINSVNVPAALQEINVPSFGPGLSSLAVTESYQNIQPQFGVPYQNINPFASSLYEMSDLLNSVAPLVNIAESLSPIRYNPCLYPLQYSSVPSINSVSSSLAIAESNPSLQSSISISEVNEPTYRGFNNVESTASSIAISESSSGISSSIAASESTVSSSDELVPVLEVTDASALSSADIQENTVAVASSVTESSSVTSNSFGTPSVVTAEASSSSISSPVASYFELAPITLEVAIPSSIPPALSSGFYNGARRTCACSPVAYELVIPSSIPAQLACSLGVIDNCTPVVCMNVEPLSC